MHDQSSTKRCNKCGEAKPLFEFSKLSQARDGLNYRCKSCEAARFQQYYAESHPAAERGRKQRERFSAKLVAGEKVCTKCGILKPFEEFHKDARKRDGLYSSCKKCWRVLTKEAKRRRRTRETPAERDARLKAFRESGKAKEYIARFKETHPGRLREYTNRYRARLRSATTEPVDFGAILKRDGMFCYLCGTPIASRAELHFDHVIPLSRGGAHSEQNIRPTHGSCNTRKQGRLIEELTNGGRLF